MGKVNRWLARLSVSTSRVSLFARRGPSDRVESVKLSSAARNDENLLLRPSVRPSVHRAVYKSAPAIDLRKGQWRLQPCGRVVRVYVYGLDTLKFIQCGQYDPLDFVFLGVCAAADHFLRPFLFQTAASIFIQLCLSRFLLQISSPSVQRSPSSSA